MVTCNALANIIPINGRGTGQISDIYANLFAPIGFTFAIWSVIYLLLAGFCVYQFRAVRKGIQGSRVSEDVLAQVLPWFIASSVLNSIWIFAWHYLQIGLSTLLITGILLCLIKVNLILCGEGLAKRDYLLVQLPFSVYFGWITIAVMANITTWLVSIRWDGWGFSDAFWTQALLAVGALIALAVFQKFRDVAYLLVIIWAYFGILAKHLSGGGFDEQYPQIITLLLVLIAIFIYRIVLHLSHRPTARD